MLPLFKKKEQGTGIYSIIMITKVALPSLREKGKDGKKGRFKVCNLQVGGEIF
jgi:hypothetical protein